MWDDLSSWYSSSWFRVTCFLLDKKDFWQDLNTTPIHKWMTLSSLILLPTRLSSRNTHKSHEATFRTSTYGCLSWIQRGLFFSNCEKHAMDVLLWNWCEHYFASLKYYYADNVTMLLHNILRSWRELMNKGTDWYRTWSRSPSLA